MKCIRIALFISQLSKIDQIFGDIYQCVINAIDATNMQFVMINLCANILTRDKHRLYGNHTISGISSEWHKLAFDEI